MLVGSDDENDIDYTKLLGDDATGGDDVIVPEVGMKFKDENKNIWVL